MTLQYPEAFSKPCWDHLCYGLGSKLLNLCLQQVAPAALARPYPWAQLSVPHCPPSMSYLLVVLNAHADGVHEDRDHDPTVEVLAVHNPSKLDPHFPPHVTAELQPSTFFHLLLLLLRCWGTLVPSAALSLLFTSSSILLVWISAAQDRESSGCVMFPPVASGTVGGIRGCCHSNGLDQALRRAVKRVVLLAKPWGEKWLCLKEKTLFPSKKKKGIQAGHLFDFWVFRQCNRAF